MFPQVMTDNFSLNLTLAWLVHQSASARGFANETVVNSSVNVPQPSASSFISLRHSPQSHLQEWPLGWLTRKQYGRCSTDTYQPCSLLRCLGWAAQRHKGGAQRAGDSRGAALPRRLGVLKFEFPCAIPNETVVNSSVNVPQPSASSFISLRHSPQSHLLHLSPPQNAN